MIKKIHRCLTPKINAIKTYKERFEELKKYNEVLKHCLPDEWRNLCQFVNIQDSVLVLSTTSQELLTRLRFMQANILKQCQKRSKLFAFIDQVDCIFTLLPQKSPHLPHPKLTTAKSAEYCLTAAERCPPMVKKSLERLSKQLLK